MHKITVLTTGPVQSHEFAIEDATKINNSAIGFTSFIDTLGVKWEFNREHVILVKYREVDK
jgi:hypothetical protein